MFIIVRQGVWSQLILFQKHLQYKPIANASIPSADTKVPIVGNVFCFNEGQELFGYALNFVKCY